MALRPSPSRCSTIVKVHLRFSAMLADLLCLALEEDHPLFITEWHHRGKVLPLLYFSIRHTTSTTVNILLRRILCMQEYKALMVT